jgi:enamine deaminase RidA (YjgF/YER057c/UK114 family)
MMSQRRLISSGSPLEPILGFSRAVRSGDMVFVAGTAPISADGETVEGDAAAQTRRCLTIIGEALEHAGASLADVVRTRVLLVHIEDWPVVAAVHGQVFADVRPACTVCQVAGFIDARWRVEIEVDARIGSC